MITDLRPINTVESKGFKHLMSILEPRYTVPGRRHFIDRLLPTLHKETVENMKKMLHGVESVALIHDMWTSLSTESYGTVTCHFISSDWGLKGFVLGTKQMEEQHTAENIAIKLQNVQTNWSLPTPPVTDNETKAIKTVLQWPHISCMGDNINLAVKAALKIPEVSKLLAKGRHTVSFFHKSSHATSVLLKKQEALLDKSAVGHKLIQDVATRWNSTLDMRQRLLEQTAAIHATLFDPVLKNSTSAVQSN